MKSRMTITTMLVVGMLMSMSGASLALDGTSGSGDAAGVQYQTETTNTVPVTTTPVTTTPVTTTPATTPAPAAPASASAPAAAQAEEPAQAEKAPAPEVKAAEQVAATEPAQQSDSLPFTGYSAIPILLGGIVVLGLGLVLRRQTRRDTP